MSNPADPSFQDEAPPRFSAGEDVLSIISGVQTELDRLKNAQRKQAEEEATLDALRHDLDTQREAVAAQAAELETLRVQFNERTVSLDAERRRLDEETAARTGALDERESALRAAEADLAGKLEELDANAARLAEESVTLHQQQARFREKQNSLEASIAAREQDLDQREQALAAEKTGVEQAARHAETLRGELERERVQLRADQDEVEAEQQRLEQQRAHVVELQSRLERASAEQKDQSGSIAALESEIARLTDALASAQAIGAESTNRIQAEIQTELDKRARAIESLAAKLRDAQTEIAALTERAATSSPENAHAGIDVPLRRERLHRLRHALHDRARALIQAKETLSTRQDEAERVLGQRRALAAARAQLRERECAIETRAGRNRGFAALFLGVLATLGLGVMNWAVVSRVFPATYLVTATLAADETSGALSADARSAWTDSIDRLVHDPRLFEVAADRMRRRGILEFSSAGVLSAYFTAHLDLAETAPGKVVLSLTGDGAERTTRVLDTFIATAISVANEASNQQSGSAVTTLAAPPLAGVTPIKDPRLVYAGVGWGASVGALTLLLLLVWRRLVIARKRFDRENAEMLAVGGRPDVPPM